MSSCAACKVLRRKCTPECIFAPYFPAIQPERFECVHQVFGASNVSKILRELNPEQREEAANSLVYQAQSRIQNPIYGCVGLISMLQQRLKQVQQEVIRAKQELSLYEEPNRESQQFMPSRNMPHHPQQMLKAQQQIHRVLNNQMMNAGEVNLGLGSYENDNNQVQDDCFHDMQLQTRGQLLIQGQRCATDEGPSTGPLLNREHHCMPYDNMPHHPQQMLEAQVLNNQMMNAGAVNLGWGSYENDNNRVQDDRFPDMMRMAYEGPNIGPSGEYQIMPSNNMPYHPQQMLDAQDMAIHQQQQQKQQVFDNQMMSGEAVVSNMGLGLENYVSDNYQVQDDHFGDMQLQTQEQLLIQGQRFGIDEDTSIGPNEENLFIEPSNNMPHHPRQMLEAQLLNNQMMNDGALNSGLGNYQVQGMQLQTQGQYMIQGQSSGIDKSPITGPSSNRELQCMPYNNMPHHPQQMLDPQDMVRLAYKQQIQPPANNRMMSAGAVVTNSGLGNYGNVNYQVQADHFRGMQLQTQGPLLIQGQSSGSNDGSSIGPSGECQLTLSNNMPHNSQVFDNPEDENYQVQDDCIRDMQIQTQEQLLNERQRSGNKGPSTGPLS